MTALRYWILYMPHWHISNHNNFTLLNYERLFFHNAYLYCYMRLMHQEFYPVITDKWTYVCTVHQLGDTWWSRIWSLDIERSSLKSNRQNNIFHDTEEKEKKTYEMRIRSLTKRSYHYFLSEILQNSAHVGVHWAKGPGSEASTFLSIGT